MHSKRTAVASSTMIIVKLWRNYRFHTMQTIAKIKCQLSIPNTKNGSKSLDYFSKNYQKVLIVSDFQSGNQCITALLKI